MYLSASARVFAPFAVILALLIGAGCEKKPTGLSAKDRAQAQVLAGEGFDLLLQALSDTSFSVSTLQASKLKFEEALDLNPKNGDANVGLALTELVLLAFDPEIVALFGGTSSSRLHIGKIATNAPPGLRRLAGMFPTAERSSLSSRSMLDWFSIDLARLAQNAPLNVGEIQDIAETVVIATLDRVVGYLKTVEDLDDWQMVLTSEQLGMEEGAQIEIDHTDIYMLDVFVHLLKAPFHTFVAYHVDIPDMSDSTGVKAAFNQTDGTFMALRPNGECNMQTFRTTLLDGVARMSSFLFSLEAETDDQTDDLIKLDPEGSGGLSPADIDSLVPGLTDFVGIMNGPITITGDFDNDAAEESVSVDISVIFTDPIPDIKGLLPPYHWDSTFQGWYWDGYPENDFSQFVFPDASMHGILPDFAPGGDSMFKAVFNIDAFPGPGPIFSIPNIVGLLSTIGLNSRINPF